MDLLPFTSSILLIPVVQALDSEDSLPILLTQPFQYEITEEVEYRRNRDMLLEREKQLQLKYKVELEKHKMDHEYRMDLLKTSKGTRTTALNSHVESRAARPKK